MTFEIQLCKTDSQQESGVLSAFGYKFSVGCAEHTDNHIIYLYGTYDDYCQATDVLQLAGL
jgi:hypothetical protein